MKIAVCAAGPEPTSSVHGHFSSAPWLLIYDDAARAWQAVGNAGGHVNGQCAGGRLAAMLSGLGVSALVTGQCGAGALAALGGAGIGVYSAGGLTASEAAEQVRSSTLPLMREACSHGAHQHDGQCSHHGH